MVERGLTRVSGTCGREGGAGTAVRKAAEVSALNLYRIVDKGGFYCQAEDGKRDLVVTGVQTCDRPI